MTVTIESTFTRRLANLEFLLSKLAPIPADWIPGRSAATVKRGGTELSPQECHSWSALVKAWREALLWREDLSVALAAMMATAISVEQVGDQLFLQVLGDAGCLRGDTPIMDPVDGSVKSVLDRWKEGVAFHVWTRQDDGSITVGEALPPSQFSVEPIYRVTLASGNQISLTAEHRFYVGGGDYASLREISLHLQTFGPYPLPSISESSLLTHASGALHSLQRTGDYQKNYFQDFHPYGEQPPLVQGISQEYPPLPSGVRIHNHCCLQTDDRDGVDRCTPISQYAYLLSMQHSPIHVSLPRYGDEFLPLQEQGTSEPSRNLCATLLHSPKLTSLGRRDLLPGRSSLYPKVRNGSSLQESLDTSLRTKLQPRQDELSLRRSAPSGKNGQYDLSRPDLIESACESLVNMEGYTSSIVEKWDAIVKIEFVGEEAYYDFHVPNTNNYWACGVFHHNSAKTQLCSGMLVSKKCVALDNITKFHSGWKDASGEDFSFLARSNHKVWITPEGDTIWSSPNFEEIMSQQRRIFDGRIGAVYGNRKEDVDYDNLRTPWIVAGTPALLDKDQSRLGDRFLRVVIPPPTEEDKRRILTRVAATAFGCVGVTSNGVAEGRLDKALAHAYRLTGGYVNYLTSNAGKLLSDVVANTDIDRWGDRCAVLADFTADMRARPADDRKSREAAASKELPTRLTHQFVRMAVCLAGVMNRKSVDSEVMKVLQRVALDTGKGHTFAILDVLDKAGPVEGMSSDNIAQSTDKGSDRERNYLRFLAKIGVVETFTWRSKSAQVGSQMRWRLTERITDLYREVKGG